MNKSTTRISFAAFGIAVLASYAIAAGGGHDHGSMPETGGDMAGMHADMERMLADTSAFGEKGDPASVTRTITVEASEIKFDAASVEIGAGETVSFVVSNKGEQPHEFTIGDAAYQETARHMMAMMADMGMDVASPEHIGAHAAAGNTLVLQPGETASLTWRFTKQGEFFFSCNFIGHSESGMIGTINVR